MDSREPCSGFSRKPRNNPLVHKIGLGSSLDALSARHGARDATALQLFAREARRLIGNWELLVSRD